jgi:invasion protein IalB
MDGPTMSHYILQGSSAVMEPSTKAEGSKPTKVGWSPKASALPKKNKGARGQSEVQAWFWSCSQPQALTQHKNQCNLEKKELHNFSKAHPQIKTPTYMPAAGPEEIVHVI